MLRTRRPLLALVALVVLLAGGYLVSALRSDPGGGSAGPAATSAPRTTGAGSPSGTRAPASPDGLEVVGASRLPAEARRTLALIDRGGPYPYARDGVTFGNVERLLPQRPRGWYREYTVPTPGESDRGARRIVAGQDGTRYYTADHYESFVRVDPER